MRRVAVFLSFFIAACGGNGEDTADPVINKNAGGSHPDILVLPRTIDFGDVAPGTGPVSELVEIENEGEDDLVLEGLNDVDAPFTLSAISSTLVGPGATTGFTVGFSPVDAGEWFETVEVRSNDPDQPNVEVSILGRSSVAGDGDTGTGQN